MSDSTLQDTGQEELSDSNTPSIDTLIARLSSKDGGIREQARHALAAIGEPAVASLLEACPTSEHQMHWEICKTLSMIGTPATVPMFVEALEDEQFEIRWLAAEGLSTIGRKHPECLVTLLRALLDRPSSVWLHEGAHHIFHDLVAHSHRAEFKPLVEALSDFDWRVRTPAAAIQVLKELEDVST
jgi:HEAT repeat protein